MKDKNKRKQTKKDSMSRPFARRAAGGDAPLARPAHPGSNLSFFMAAASPAALRA